MITASECRREAALYLDAAQDEHTGIRTALLNLTRSWTAMANQVDRLAALRGVAAPAPMKRSSLN